MRRLMGGYSWGWVQYKMFAGDQGWIGLIRHGHMLHGTCLYERRRKAAEQRELSAEHYRACWELLSVAPWKGLPGVDGKSMGRHRRNSV